MERLVGAGGWAYFDVPAADRLAAYAKAFPFVEVNSTFYEHPDPRTVAAWRRRAPARFRFAVRAHRELTHRYGLRPTAAARASFARTARMAAKLDAVAIVLETPASLTPDPRHVTDLLGAADLPCPVALEVRAYAGRGLPPELAAAMETNDVADAVDFSRQEPRTESTIAYGRMFGLGPGNPWEFTDDEMVGLRETAERGDRMCVAYTFHGVRMYKDAGRFLTYVRTGKFPRVTRHAGLRSLEEVLGEAATFPATKGELLRDHGFRVIDLSPGHTVHARDVLTRLPSARYPSAGRVVAALAGAVGGMSRLS